MAAEKAKKSIMLLLNQGFVCIIKEALVFFFFKGDNGNPDMLEERLTEHFIVSTWTCGQPPAFLDAPFEIFIMVFLFWYFIVVPDLLISFGTLDNPGSGEFKYRVPDLPKS